MTFFPGDLTPDNDNVFMEAVQGMFLSNIYGIPNGSRSYHFTTYFTMIDDRRSLIDHIKPTLPFLCYVIL